jgi:hypothetical protein
MKKSSVLIATTTAIERSGWYHPQLANFLAAAACEAQRGERKLKTLRLDNYRPIDSARNCAANEFLKLQFDWLLFLDNDAAPAPGTTLLQMLDQAGPEMDIVAPRFFVVTGNGRDNEQSLRLGWQLFPGQTVSGEWNEILGCATHCVAIRKRVLQGMTKPFFQFTYDENGVTKQGEDLNFCEKARAAGFTIWGNNAHEVDHVHTFSLSVLARLVSLAQPAQLVK